MRKKISKVPVKKSAKKSTPRKVSSILTIGVIAIGLVVSSVNLVPRVAIADVTANLPPITVGNHYDWGQLDWGQFDGMDIDTKKVSSVLTNDENDSYMFTHDGYNVQTFGIANANVPADATVNSVVLYAVAKSATGEELPDHPTIALRVEHGTGADEVSDGSDIDLGEYTTYDRVMAVNPFTALPWTAAEVNSWPIKFGVVKTNSIGTARLTQLYAVVDYTLTPQSSGTNDVCPNLDGIQEAVPSGFHLSQETCVADETISLASSGGGGGGGGQRSGVTIGNVPAGNSVMTGNVASTLTGEVLGTETCSTYLGDYLRIGRPNNHDQVKKLQLFLNKNLDKNLPVTGFFGQLTFDAVEEFQVKYWEEVLKSWVPYGLPTEKTSTGYVYKTTRRWINMLECPALNLPMPQLP